MGIPLPDGTDARIRDALSGDRKLEAVRLYREATGASLADAKAYIDRLGTGAAPADGPASSLTDHGWQIEPADGDGVRLRRSAVWRVAMVGCSLAVVLLFAPVAVVLWFLGGRIWDVPAGDGVWQVIALLVPLAFVGVAGLFFTAVLWQILTLALWREEWEAKRDRLVVWRGLLGYQRRRELTGGELVLEPHFGPDRDRQLWRLSAVCNGEKHYLLREPAVHIGLRPSHDSHAEAAAIATLLAEHTGWQVSRSGVAIEGEWKPPSESNEDELLAALRSHRFQAELDEQMRLTIRPPRLGRWVGGVALFALGLGGLWLMSNVVASFVNHARARQQPVFDPAFWLLATPMLMAGVGLCALGVAAGFGRARWTADRNLLLVRWRLFGWKTDHGYVNGRWRLTAITRTTSRGHRYTEWQLLLENPSGCTLKVLHSDTDDDVPRLLGTLLSHRTGWPLEDLKS
jgi:hypothetical protein